MAPAHGKDASFKIEDSAGTTLRDISPYITSVTFNQQNDTHDTTTYGDEGHEFIAGLTNGNIQINFLYDVSATTGANTVLDSLVGLDDITVGWEWSPQGTATGKPKYSGEGVLQDIGTSAPVADLVTGTATIQISGSVTKGTN